jgi:exodeoxyribonuclease VII small subunit
MEAMTFEQAYAELEDIVAQLESGALSLEDSVRLYERGQALARRCGEMLDAAELRIQQCAEDGTLTPVEE